MSVTAVTVTLEGAQDWEGAGLGKGLRASGLQYLRLQVGGDATTVCQGRERTECVREHWVCPDVPSLGID